MTLRHGERERERERQFDTPWNECRSTSKLILPLLERLRSTYEKRWTGYAGWVSRKEYHDEECGSDTDSFSMRPPCSRSINHGRTVNCVRNQCIIVVIHRLVVIYPSYCCLKWIRIDHVDFLLVRQPYLRKRAWKCFHSMLNMPKSSVSYC